MKNLNKEIESYVESKRNLWSNNTTRVTRSVLRTVASDFGSPDKIYQSLIQKGHGKYTIKTYLTISGSFEREVFGTATIQNFLQRNRPAFRNSYKEKTTRITREQFDGYLDRYRATNYNLYNLLILMGKAGLRISEALSAKWEDYENGFLKVIGKGDKQRLVPFSLDLLLGDKREGKIIGTIAYRYFFKRDLAPFTPHDFRSYFATQLTELYRELSVKDLAQLLGHSSITTTEKYMRSDLNRIAGILNK